MDFENIFANAKVFNHFDTIYYKYAHELSNYMQQQFFEYLKKKNAKLPKEEN